MKLTATQKRVLIEVHPDRHGGDHSLLERFFEVLRRPSQAMNSIRRCVHCGVRIGGRRTCQTHQHVRRAIATLFLVTTAFAGQTTLTWDPVAGATNYILVARTNTLDNTNALSSPLKIGTGTNNVVTVYNLSPASIYQFGVMAQNASGISDLSNIVPVQTPIAPSQRVVQAQYAVVGTNGIANFTDAVGVVWQLKIGP